MESFSCVEAGEQEVRKRFANLSYEKKDEDEIPLKLV